MHLAGMLVSRSVSGMAARLPQMRDTTHQAASVGAVGVSLVRLARSLPLWLWIVAALLAAPWYLAYMAWVLTRVGGVETFMPRTP